jgi:hypothetical protein
MSEEVSVDNYNPHQLVTYKVIDDEGKYPDYNVVSHYERVKVTELERILDDGKKLAKTLEDCKTNYRNVRDSLSTSCNSLKEHILERWGDAGYDERESLKWIADLFNIELNRIISFVAHVEITGQYEVDIDYSEGDLEMYISDELEIDGRGSLEVHNWEITRVTEYEDGNNGN